MSKPRTTPKKPRRARAAEKQPAPRWQLQTAKARFSEVFRRARSEGPQWITRQDREAVVMLPAGRIRTPHRTGQTATEPRQVFCPITSGKGGNRSGEDAGLRPPDRLVSGFLLDTNVISRLVKPRPEDGVCDKVDQCH